MASPRHLVFPSTKICLSEFCPQLAEVRPATEREKECRAALGRAPEVEGLDEKRLGSGVRALTRNLLRDGEAEIMAGVDAPIYSCPL